MVQSSTKGSEKRVSSAMDDLERVSGGTAVVKVGCKRRYPRTEKP